MRAFLTVFNSFIYLVVVSILVTVILTLIISCGGGPHLPVAATPKDSSADFNKVLPVFVEACSECHNATSGRGNWLDPNIAHAYRPQIYQHVWVARDMPPAGHVISEKNREVIATWARATSGSSGGTASAPDRQGTNDTEFENSSEASMIDPRAGMKGWAGYDSVTRGGYLTRVANCFSCHTSLTPGAAVGAGGRKIETAFGVLLTPNITPDADTGIGLWTPEEFYQALHNGIRNDGEYLYPVFPYTSYTKMPRADVDDIYAYLMSLQPQRNKVDVNQLNFPFRIRLSLKVWRTLYFTPGEFEPDSWGDKQWNRGKYLVTGPGHCGECHTPRNFMGALEKGKEFMGSEVDNWYGSNLRYSARNGISQWSQADLVNFLGTGAASGKATVVGPMAEVVFNSLQYLTLNDLKAIAFYLSVISAPGFYDEKQFRNEFNIETGEKIYAENCAKCHKLSGLGTIGEYPPFFQNPVVNQDRSTNLIDVLLLGVPRQGAYSAMPSFSQKLNDDEIASLANYIRVRWGSASQPEVTAKDVAAKRAALCPPP
jgi:mono/diheme cytochrome c family protein